MAKKIVIVDDEPHILRVAAFRLGSEGYEVLSESDGGRAYQLIRDETPDLVILDIRLPTLDGCEICRRMKEDAGLRCIPVILFTAAEAGEVLRMAEEVGADGWLGKPFDGQTLLARVKQLMDDNQDTAV